MKTRCPIAWTNGAERLNLGDPGAVSGAERKLKLPAGGQRKVGAKARNPEKRVLSDQFQTALRMLYTGCIPFVLFYPIGGQQVSSPLAACVAICRAQGWPEDEKKTAQTSISETNRTLVEKKAYMRYATRWNPC